MLKRLFLHPGSGPVANWLAIVTAVGGGVAWLFRQTPEWLGQLTWPQSILLGLGFAVAVLFAFSATAALFAYAFHRFRPSPISETEIGTPGQIVLSEAELALAACKNVDGTYDYSKLRAEMDRITSPGREYDEAWADFSAKEDGSKTRMRLTDTDRERCAETLRDVHDFIGGEMRPYITDITNSNSKRPSDTLKDLPDLNARREVLAKQASLLWHRHAHYIDLMKLQLISVLQALEGLKNPMEDGIAAIDWPEEAQLERARILNGGVGALQDAVREVWDSFATKRKEYIDG